MTEIYSVGGAQAVGALAYGTETIEPVAKITGPGNAYVAAAKKIVSGDVGIDMIAGPSEVCVVADETADPALVAIDLMAQAEHDPLAACYLVTFSEEYADQIEAAIERHVKHSTRAEITMASLNDHGLITICPDRKAAIQAVNVIAPEHLELHVENAMDLLGSIENAGAIFFWGVDPGGGRRLCGRPQPPLPTGGTARYASPLSVEEFVKKSSIIQYTPEALATDADSVMTIARHEGLWAHAMSVELRCNECSLASRPKSMQVRALNSVRQSAPQLQGLVPYDPKYLPARAYLSANENPRDVETEIRQKIISAIRKVPLNRYPDPLANDLRDMIAEANEPTATRCFWATAATSFCSTSRSPGAGRDASS